MLKKVFKIKSISFYESLNDSLKEKDTNSTISNAIRILNQNFINKKHKSLLN